MKLSIIIPIYNAEKYLPRCIDSIVKQLSRDVELILVDDGSTDESSKICDQYAEQYSSIRVCHVTNGGTGVARNTGMELAEGEWITFVDADDYVTDHFVNTILEHTETDLDVVLFEYLEADGSKIKTSEKGKKSCQYYDADCHELFIQNNFLAKEIMDDCNFNMRSVWAKAYRRSLLEKNEIIFNSDVKIGEDMLFLLTVYESFNKAKCVPVVIYYYFFRNETSITNQYKPDFQSIIQSYIKAIIPWLEKYPQYCAYHANYRLNDIILYMKYDFFHCGNKEEKKHLKRRMKSIFVDGIYKEYYEQAKESKLLFCYGIEKRLVFYLALHGQYWLLKLIAHIKYGE